MVVVRVGRDGCDGGGGGISYSGGGGDGACGDYDGV